MSPLLQLLRWSFPLCFVGAITVFIYAVASTPSGSSLRLGMRGLARSRVLQHNLAWRELEPLVRWAGVRVAPLLSQRARDYLDRQITYAGDLLGLLPEELVALVGLSSASGLSLGTVCALMLERKIAVFALLGLLLGALLPYLKLVGLQDDRRRSVRNGLPCVIDLLSLALSAGTDFPGAVKQVIAKSSNPDDPLIEELNVILYELSVGKTRRDALLGFAGRMPVEAVRDFVSAVVQAEERGSPLEEVLRIQAQSSRERRTVLAEENAARAGVKMFGPILIIFCVVMMLILAPLILGLEQTLFQD